MRNISQKKIRKTNLIGIIKVNYKFKVMVMIEKS